MLGLCFDFGDGDVGSRGNLTFHEIFGIINIEKVEEKNVLFDYEFHLYTEGSRDRAY